MTDHLSLPKDPQIGDLASAEPASSTDPAHATTVQWKAGKDSVQRTLGRYHLESVIGRGGFGEVCRGFDPDLDRPVAIKILRLHDAFSQDTIDQLLCEGRRLAQVSHPSIVTVFDVGYEDGCVFIVTALIEGLSLAASLRDRERYSPADAAVLVAEMARAAHAAHLQGIVHRDIKPANILLDRHDRPFLADFGIAASEEDQLTETAAVLGTSAYMAPEQVRGESNVADARADVYSLGVVLYELLTGRLPFLANKLEQYVELILHREPRPPRTIDDGIPAALEAICLKCLSKRVDERYTTALDLAEALSSWKESATERKRTSSRRPAILCAIGILVAVAVIVIISLRSRSAPPALPDSSAGSTVDSSHEPVAWKDLLLESPTPLLQCIQGNVRVVNPGHSLLVDSPALASAWSFGETDAIAYELEFEFEIPESAVDASTMPTLGLILGASREKGDTERWRMQMMQLRPSQGGRPATLRRIIATSSRDSRNEIDVGQISIATQAIDCKLGKRHSLSLVVGPIGLQKLMWDGKPMPRMVSEQINSHLERSLYEGRIGIFVDHAEFVLKRVRFRVLDPELVL